MIMEVTPSRKLPNNLSVLIASVRQSQEGLLEGAANFIERLTACITQERAGCRR